MKKVLCWMGLFVAVFAWAGFSNQAMAANADFINICYDQDGKSIKVSRPLLEVPNDTIVVWFNGVEDREIQIIFRDGKVCKDVTTKPVAELAGFFLNAKDCYVTDFLPYCATSTLRFPGPGKYEYKAVTLDGKMETKGTIMVGP